MFLFKSNQTIELPFKHVNEHVGVVLVVIEAAVVSGFWQFVPIHPFVHAQLGKPFTKIHKPPFGIFSKLIY